MKGKTYFAACCIAALVAAGSACATPYQFVVTGSETIRFVLDSSPTPDISIPGSFFVFNSVSGTVDNQAATFDLGFGSASYLNNFGLFNNSVGPSVFGTGLPLYTGTEAAPTFKLGTFALDAGYSLTISGVPEPTSWAMLLIGFGALGTVVRRRRNITVRVRFSG